MAVAADRKSHAGVEIRPGGRRGYTKLDWLEGWHSFNFGPHQEPGNESFGLMVVHNDDIVQPRTGFTTHPHNDLEIITWPIDGRIDHRDSMGEHREVWPGRLQQMTAGSGILHSELNPQRDLPSRWVQMWIVPDEPALTPRYQDADVADALEGGGLVPLVGRRNPDALLDHHQRDAVFHAGRLDEQGVAELPDAPFVHLYVTRGAVELEDTGTLSEGDAARLTDAGPRRIRAADGAAEVIVWEMYTTVVRQLRAWGR